MMTDNPKRARDAIVSRRYRKRRQLLELQGVPTAPVPAAPIRAHVRRLLDLGWGTPALLAAAGVNATPTGLLLLVNGTSIRAERKFAALLDLPLNVHVPDAVPEECWVPALGATRRVRALMALGWRHEDISPMIGRSSHHIAAQRHNTIGALDWRLVDAAYDAMSGTPGPSDRSRRRALTQGYAPPLAWDDIDDPDETPTLGATGRRSASDLLAEYDHLRSLGVSEHHACQQLGVTRSAIERARMRGAA